MCICMHTCMSRTNGGRVYGSPAVPFVKGAYSPDPHYLARFDVDADDYNNNNSDNSKSGIAVQGSIEEEEVSSCNSYITF